MNKNPAEHTVSGYRENVVLPLWGIGVLGLLLGVTAGTLTGVLIRNAVGDDPLITGSSASAFYVAFSLAVVIDVFLLLNFTNLSIRVDDRGLRFRYGMFSRSFAWQQIRSASAVEYRWMAFGGWGIRLSTGGRRAWSQLGVKRGVEVQIESSNRKTMRYFISSTRPEELAEAISRGISSGGVNSGDEP